MSKVTEHFNGLTEAEQERLAILIEECGEVVQAACKILRHGYESRNPHIPLSGTNRQGLERELGDLLHAVARIQTARDVDIGVIEARGISKGESISPYLHHQASAGDQRCSVIA